MKVVDVHKISECIQYLSKTDKNIDILNIHAFHYSILILNNGLDKLKGSEYWNRIREIYVYPQFEYEEGNYQSHMYNIYKLYKIEKVKICSLYSQHVMSYFAIRTGYKSLIKSLASNDSLDLNNICSCDYPNEYMVYVYYLKRKKIKKSWHINKEATYNIRKIMENLYKRFNVYAVNINDKIEYF